MTDITVIGAGLMGAAIIDALLASGRTVTVWNRTPEKVAALEARGALSMPTAADALVASPVAMFVIVGYDSVRELLASCEGTLPQVVNFTSGGVTDADELDLWVTAHGGELLEGAITAFPSQMGGADTPIWYSGSRAVWDRHEALLRDVAGRSTYLGPEARLANVVDGVTLAYATAAQAAMLEAAAYGAALGLSNEMTFLCLDQVGRHMIDRYSKYAGPKVASGDHTTTEATVDTWSLPIHGLAAAVRHAGVPGRQITAAAASLAAAQAAGYGDADFTSIYLLAEETGAP
jgi:3-hydroxyisobutyrate dehydrogenase-like beta-hydroxyacid dehydrogenase